MVRELRSENSSGRLSAEGRDWGPGKRLDLGETLRYLEHTTHVRKRYLGMLRVIKNTLISAQLVRPMIRKKS